MDELAFYHREDRPWPNPRLDRAAMVGHVTHRSARLWLRVKRPGRYRLILAPVPIPTDGRPTVRRRGGTERAGLVRAGAWSPLPGRLSPAREFAFTTDLTEVFDLEGLQPGTTYHYALFAEPGERDDWERCWIVGRDDPHRFRTAPERSDEATFGLFSCHMPYDRHGGLVHVDMWERLEEELDRSRADFVLGAGDQVYADGHPRLDIWRWLRKNVRRLPASAAEQHALMVSWYRDIYRGYWGPLPLRRVFRAYPTYMAWDDHEIVDGWGSLTDEELSDRLDTLFRWENRGRNLALAKRMFRAAKQVYVEYAHSRHPPTPRGQLDYAFDRGPCAVRVLDGRGRRRHEGLPGQRVLGAAQGRRLLRWLASDAVAAAEVAFIVSPVPFVHASSFVTNNLDINRLLGLADDLRDEWEHESNWEERDRILDAVFETSERRGQRIVFLSGDVHVGAAFRLTKPRHPGASVYQLTSSAITHATAPGRLLRLAVRDAGTLGAPAEARRTDPTGFRLLHVCSRNNFGLVRVRPGPGGASEVCWDLFGRSDEAGAVCRLTTVRLDPAR